VHDRPTTVELVEAVREFLESDVLDAVEGRVKFHVKVAINVLGMVERELAEDPEAEARHLSALAGILGHDGPLTDLEAELAAAIREGRMDGRPDVLAAVTAEVRRKLAVSNPGYSLD
jgi:hypothetical protein